MGKKDKENQEPRLKIRSAHLGSWLLVLLVLSVLSVLLFAVWFALPSTAQQLVYVTGEEGRFPQLRGLWNLALDHARPPLQLAPDAKIDNLPPNQFGANTFLEQEVELWKARSAARLTPEPAE